MRTPFHSLFETRTQQWKLSELASWSELGGAAPTAAGVVVTPEIAVRVPAVYSCINVLSQDVAKTATKLRRRVADDVFEDADDHPLWEALFSLANPEETTYTFKFRMMQHLLTYSRAYAEIQRDERGTVEALWVLDPTRMTIQRDAARRKVYTYALDDGGIKTWTFDPNRPPLLELVHDSPIGKCRELVGLALALQTYTGKFFANGARLNGFLHTDQKLSPKAFQHLRESFDAHYSGAERAWKTMILEEGLKFSAAAAPNDSAQLLETSEFIATATAGVFRIPPHKIGLLRFATYSNISEQSVEYINQSLDPYYTCWEQAIRRDLLTTRQYPRFDVYFDREAMVRSDTKSRMEALTLGRQHGIYSANDVRRKLGENPIPPAGGGDLYLVSEKMRTVGRDEDGPTIG